MLSHDGSLLMSDTKRNGNAKHGSQSPAAESFKICLFEPDERIERLKHVFQDRAAQQNILLSITPCFNVLTGRLRYEPSCPDIVVLDLSGPEADLQKFKYLEELREIKASTSFYLVVVVKCGDCDNDRAVRKHGADDVIIRPLRLENFVGHILRIAVFRRQSMRMASELHSVTKELVAIQIEAVESLCRVVQTKDNRTGNHIFRVGEYASMIAANLGYSAEECGVLQLAAKIHDIGKLYVPDLVLLQTKHLSKAQFSKYIKPHPEKGLKAIKDTTRNPIVEVAKSVVIAHHERWDGTGYPYGLAGKDIPKYGRIVAVADVFDALTHARSYKEAWDIDEALRFLVTQKEKEFDPEVVEAFLAGFEGLAHEKES